MKPKHLKINWEDLEDAFNRKRNDVASYLDRVTGHIVMEGEGEEDDLDDESSYGRLSTPAPKQDDGTRIYVHPPPTARKIEWLKVFMERDELDAEIKARLVEAVEADDPAPAITQVLLENPDEREAWFLYRADRTREMIDEWLAENSIVPVDPAPWKN